jgi:hypothetical protein
MSFSNANDPNNDNAANLDVWLVSISFSVGLSFLAAELLGTNRFLRTSLQVYGWVYVLSDLVLLGLAFGGSMLAFPKLRRLTIGKMLLLGLGLGVASSFVALSIAPLLMGKGVAPSLSAWKQPAWWGLAIGVSLGWLYGSSVAFVSHSLVKRHYLRLVYLLLTCAAIRTIELVLS